MLFCAGGAAYVFTRRAKPGLEGVPFSDQETQRLTALLEETQNEEQR